MKKFKFRLEPLLKLRAYKEKEEQKVHAAALQKIYNQEDKLVNINTDRFNNQKSLRNILSGCLDLSRLSGYSRYFMKIKKDEYLDREMLKVFQKDTEEKRLKLLEATKQRKIYEKLKEKHHEKYNHEFEQVVQKEQDEIGTQIARQKKTPAKKQEP